MKRQLLILASSGLLLVALTACGSGSAEDDAPAAAPATVTETVTPSPSPTPEPAPVETPTPSQGQDDSGVGNSAPGGATFAMPNEVGKALQAAQDDLQAVSGNPFFFSDSEDASGLGRFQVLDSGWQVCTQNVAPGTALTAENTDVIFGVVRTGESCP